MINDNAVLDARDMAAEIAKAKGETCAVHEGMKMPCPLGHDQSFAFDFASVWEQAPRAVKRHCMLEDAEFFYLMGIRDGHAKGAVEANETLAEMVRLMKARGLI